MENKQLLDIFGVFKNISIPNFFSLIGEFKLSVFYSIILFVLRMVVAVMLVFVT